MEKKSERSRKETKRIRGADRRKKKVIKVKDFVTKPRHHKYSVGHAKLFIEMALDAISLRGTSRAVKKVASALQLPLEFPEWHTGRLWLLRLGYYELHRQKEKADDWIWIVDHTIQIGSTKCFVILGIRLKDLPQPGQSIGLQDVELIALEPVDKSNSEIVLKQLEETIEKTGIPRLIVADHGPDLKAGIEKFCQKHQEVDYVYDVKHKTARILKCEFEENEKWVEFIKKATHTKHKLQRSSLAHLVPPNQRSKARYMNIDVLVRWGGDMLAFFDEEQNKNSTEYDKEELQEKLGWITFFRQSISEWQEIVLATDLTENFVRKQGLYLGAELQLQKLLDSGIHNEQAKEVCGKLIEFVKQESSKAKNEERLLGSSEVIESLLGKLKYLENDQAKSGFTSLILSIGALVSSTASDVIQNALESVSTQKIQDWRQKMLGDSVQAKRKRALNAHRKTEEKWNHLFSPI
ncbi:MAG: hypothetical protein U9O54_08055 [Chloroflexota bacterium]|nr:hypothetical protein [Chloroflexota bacterium]